MISHQDQMLIGVIKICILNGTIRLKKGGYMKNIGIVFLCLCLLIMPFFTTSCSVNDGTKVSSVNEGRYTIENCAQMSWGNLYLLTDTHSGKEFLLFSGGYKAAMCQTN